MGAGGEEGERGRGINVGERRGRGREQEDRGQQGDGRKSGRGWHMIGAGRGIGQGEERVTERAKEGCIRRKKGGRD